MKIYFFIFIIPIILLNATKYNFEYSYIPKYVYENQVFPISFIHKNNSNLNKNIQFNFSKNFINKPLNDEPIVSKNSSLTFYTFYFKVKNKNEFIIPSCEIKINNKIISSFTTYIIPIINLIYREDFSNILAFNLKIKKYDISVHDINNNIINLTLEANDANFEDIRMTQFNNITVTKIYKLNYKSIIECFVIYPYKEDRLSFIYFDTMKDKFIQKIIPLSLKIKSPRETHKSLITKDESFNLIKVHTLIIIIVLSLIAFLVKYDFIYFLIGFISFIILIIFFINLETVKIKKNSPIFIIPIKNSTIAEYITSDIKVDSLNKYNGYVKIFYNNKIIGWVKDENTMQD